MARSRKREDETYAQYLLRISPTRSNVYDQKPAKKPEVGSVESVVKAAASTSKPSNVYKQKPPKTGSVEWMAQQGKNKGKKEPPKPAEVKPAKPPIRASEQSTTVSKPKPQPRDTRNDEYNKLRIKAQQSGKQEDVKAAESAGMAAWRKANPKLAAALDKKNAAKNGEKPAAEQPASKKGVNDKPYTSSSNQMTGGTPFNERGMFDKDKKKKRNNGGTSSYT